MAGNAIALSALVLNGIPIPMAGDDTFADFVADPDYEISDGVNGPIFNLVPNPKGTITVTTYATDPANAILTGIANADRAAQGLVPLAGSLTTASGESVSFSEAKITQRGSVTAQKNASTKTWTIIVGRHQQIQVPVV